jgi:hypothetical protein
MGGMMALTSQLTFDFGYIRIFFYHRERGDHGEKIQLSKILSKILDSIILCGLCELSGEKKPGSIGPGFDPPRRGDKGHNIYPRG